MSAKKPSGIRLPTSTEGKVKKWLQVRQLIMKAEPLKKALEPYVRDFVGKAPGRIREFGTSTIRLIAVSGGKRFNIDAATEALGKKVLASFWEMKPFFNIDAATEAIGEDKLAPFWEDLPGYDRLRVD